MKLRLYQDSRDLHSYQAFGSTLLLDLPSVKNFDDPTIAEKVQPIGDVRCGDYSVTYLAQNKTKKEYDMDALWSTVPHSRLGVIPNDIFSEVIKRGLKVKGTDTYDKPYNSYYRADTDPRYDKFDSTRSSQIQVDSPVIIYTSWYKEWLNLGPNAVMPIGKTPISGHMYVSTGWFDGDDFVVEWWGGYTLRMPREVFNRAVGEYGCGAVVFSTLEQDLKRKKTVAESIRDLCVNALLLSRQLLTLLLTKQQTMTIDTTASQRLYDLSYSLIGKHLTLDNSVPAKFGCAEAVSKLLVDFGNKQMLAMGISSTPELEKWLELNCTEVSTPETGNIIISVSYTGVSGARGHVGVVGLKAIMSNDSESGLWEPYWSLAGWLGYYRDTLKLRTRYFKVK